MKVVPCMFVHVQVLMESDELLNQEKNHFVNRQVNRFRNFDFHLFRLDVWRPLATRGVADII